MSSTRSKVDKLREGKRLMDADAAYLPPQALELEEMVIGAMLLDRVAFMHIGILRPEHFYNMDNAQVFACIKDMYLAGEAVDMLTVMYALKKRGIVKVHNMATALWLSNATHKIASAANMETHIRVIIEKWMRRQMWMVGNVMAKDAFDEEIDVFDVRDKAQRDVLMISDATSERSTTSVPQKLIGVIDKIKANKDKRGLTGVPTGYLELDELTGGWQNNNVIVVGARPGMGKTAIALNFALRASKCYGKQVLFFSLEMSAEQLVTRLLAMVTGIVGNNLTASHLHDFEWNRLESAKDVLNAVTSFEIDDTPAISIAELQSKAFKKKMTTGLDMIIIDYIQIMSPADPRAPREVQISQLSGGIKRVAKMLDVPIILLAQLSRDVEKRGGRKKPTLADLRESGAIEQDADMVMFPYRPSYYKITEDEDGNPIDDTHFELIVAKHRNGGLADMVFKGILPTNRILGRIPDGSGFRYESETVYTDGLLYQQQ